MPQVPSRTESQQVAQEYGVDRDSARTMLDLGAVDVPTPAEPTPAETTPAEPTPAETTPAEPTPASSTDMAPEDEVATSPALPNRIKHPITLTTAPWLL